MASCKYLKDNRRWQVRYHITCADGEVLKGSQCFLKRSDAEEYKAGIEARADRLRSGLTQPGQAIDRAVRDWLDYCQRYTERTRIHYAMAIERFIKSLPKEIVDIRHISSRHIILYINELLHRSINRTANAHLTAIKSFCRYLADFHEMPNPSINIKMLTEAPPTPRFLRQDEYELVVAATEGETRGRQREIQ